MQKDAGGLGKTESSHNRQMMNIVKAEWINNLNIGDTIVLKLYDSTTNMIIKTVYNGIVKNIIQSGGSITSILISYKNDHGVEVSEEIPSSELFKRIDVPENKKQEISAKLLKTIPYTDRVRKKDATAAALKTGMKTAAGFATDLIVPGAGTGALAIDAVKGKYQGVRETQREKEEKEAADFLVLSKIFKNERDINKIKSVLNMQSSQVTSSQIFPALGEGDDEESPPSSTSLSPTPTPTATPTPTPETSTIPKTVSISESPGTNDPYDDYGRGRGHPDFGKKTKLQKVEKYSSSRGGGSGSKYKRKNKTKRRKKTKRKKTRRNKKKRR